MTGILYGIGVGPGDPELITLKAVRIMKECDIIAVPETGAEDNVAFKIAEAYIEDKYILKCLIPMTGNKEIIDKAYDEISEAICQRLMEGKTVGFLTLGDPTVYSTFCYIHKRVMRKNFDSRIIPGVPSFCAVAATLNESLCEGNEAMHIVPSFYEGTEDFLELKGTKVLMKSGKKMKDIVEVLNKKNILNRAKMVERCGMAEQKVYSNLENLEKNPGYFSTIIVKD